MYPTFYNHDALFMYLNDRWYELFAVQLWFTITDDACVVLRWCKSKQNLRLAFRAMHLLFNVMFEKNVFHPRNMFFCLDDAVSILYIHLHEVPALGTNRMWWTKRVFWNALVIASLVSQYCVPIGCLNVYGRIAIRSTALYVIITIVIALRSSYDNYI